MLIRLRPYAHRFLIPATSAIKSIHRYIDYPKRVSYSLQLGNPRRDISGFVIERLPQQLFDLYRSMGVPVNPVDADGPTQFLLEKYPLVTWRNDFGSRFLNAGPIDYIWTTLQEFMFVAGLNQWRLKVPIGIKQIDNGTASTNKPWADAAYRRSMNGALELSWSNIWSRSVFDTDPIVQTEIEHVSTYRGYNGTAGFGGWNPGSPLAPVTIINPPGSNPSSYTDYVRVYHPKYVRFASLRVGVGAIQNITEESIVFGRIEYLTTAKYDQSMKCFLSLRGHQFSEFIAPRHDWVTTYKEPGGKTVGFRQIEILGFRRVPEQADYSGLHHVGYNSSGKKLYAGSHNGIFIYWTGIIDGERRYAATLIDPEYLFSRTDPITLTEISITNADRIAGFSEIEIPLYPGQHAPSIGFGTHFILKISWPPPEIGPTTDPEIAHPPLDSGYCAVALEFTPPLINYNDALPTWNGLGTGLNIEGQATPSADSDDNWGTDIVHGFAFSNFRSWGSSTYPQRIFTNPDWRVGGYIEDATSGLGAGDTLWNSTGSGTSLSVKCSLPFSGIRSVGLEYPKYARWPSQTLVAPPRTVESIDYFKQVPQFRITQQVKQVFLSNQIVTETSIVHDIVLNFTINIKELPLILAKIDIVPFNIENLLCGYSSWTSDFIPILISKSSVGGSHLAPDPPNYAQLGNPGLARGNLEFGTNSLIGKYAIFRYVDQDKFLVAPRSHPAHSTMVNAHGALCYLHILDCDDSPTRNPAGRSVPDPLRFDDLATCATPDRRGIPQRIVGPDEDSIASVLYADWTSSSYIAQAQRAMESMLTSNLFGNGNDSVSDHIQSRYTTRGSHFSKRVSAGNIPFAKPNIIPQQVNRTSLTDWETDEFNTPLLIRQVKTGSFDHPEMPYSITAPKDIQLDEIVPIPPALIRIQGYEFSCAPYIRTRILSSNIDGNLLFDEIQMRSSRSNLNTAGTTSGVSFIGHHSSTVNRSLPPNPPIFPEKYERFITDVGLIPSPALAGLMPPNLHDWRRQGISVWSSVDLGASITIRCKVLRITPHGMWNPNNAPLDAKTIAWYTDQNLPSAPAPQPEINRIARAIWNVTPLGSPGGTGFTYTSSIRTFQIPKSGIVDGLSNEFLYSSNTIGVESIGMTFDTPQPTVIYESGTRVSATRIVPWVSKIIPADGDLRDGGSFDVFVNYQGPSLVGVASIDEVDAP